MKFNDIIGKRIVVHCDTEEKANEFLRQCENIGTIWSNGEYNATYNKNMWKEYKQDTCYRILKDENYIVIGYCPVVFFKHMNSKIVEFDDIVFED